MNISRDYMSYDTKVISVHNVFIHPVELLMSSICADEKLNFLFVSCCVRMKIIIFRFRHWNAYLKFIPESLFASLTGKWEKQTRPFFGVKRIDFFKYCNMVASSIEYLCRSTIALKIQWVWEQQIELLS